MGPKSHPPSDLSFLFMEQIKIKIMLYILKKQDIYSQCLCNTANKADTLSSLIKLMLCWTLNIFRRGENHSEEISLVSETRAATWLGVLSLNWESFQSPLWHHKDLAHGIGIKEIEQSFYFILSREPSIRILLLENIGKVNFTNLEVLPMRYWYPKWHHKVPSWTEKSWRMQAK